MSLNRWSIAIALMNSQIKQNWIDYMSSHGLIQHVNQPTRVVPNISSTLIDHIYTNFSDNVKFIEFPKIGLSDHYPVFVTRKTGTLTKKASHHTIRYRFFKSFDERKFNEDIQSVPWDITKVFEDADDALDSWYSLLLEVTDKHVPIKQHRVKRKNQPNWLTSDIIDSIKTRDRYKALGNDSQFKI